MSVDAACFLSCPCGNLLFLHTHHCAYFGEADVGAAPLLDAEAAPAAQIAAQAEAAAELDAASSNVDGHALSLERDGICVVFSSVRPYNDNGEDADVVTVAENIVFHPM